MKTNKTERVKMVKAMEFIARQLNDECITDYWLTWGVADGDIEYGDLKATGVKQLDGYLDDENFSDLMDTFLYAMQKAYYSRGLFCDGVVSRQKD